MHELIQHEEIDRKSKDKFDNNGYKESRKNKSVHNNFNH